MCIFTMPVALLLPGISAVKPRALHRASPHLRLIDTSKLSIWCFSRCIILSSVLPKDFHLLNDRPRPPRQGARQRTSAMHIYYSLVTPLRIITHAFPQMKTFDLLAFATSSEDHISQPTLLSSTYLRSLAFGTTVCQDHQSATPKLDQCHSR